MTTPKREYVSTLRVRMSAHDAHYGGNLVNGARALALFGDVATELAIQCDGDEGLLVGYERIEFLAPVYAGDFIEATGRIIRMGRTRASSNLWRAKSFGLAQTSATRRQTCWQRQWW